MSFDRAQLAALYDGFASRYDQCHEGGFRKYARIERTMRDLLSSGQVLDLGCGTGRLLKLTANQQVVGIDISLEMLRKTADVRQRVAQADGHQMPFEDQAFDALIAAQGVIRYMRLRDAFAEFFRILKPGGMCAIHQFGNALSFRRLRPSKNPLSLTSLRTLTMPAQDAGLSLKHFELWRSLSSHYPYAIRIPPGLPVQLWNHCMVFFQKPELDSL